MNSLTQWLETPTGRESWKYSDPAPLTGDRFAPFAAPAPPAGDLPLLPACADSRRLVFWNETCLADETAGDDRSSGMTIAALTKDRAAPGLGTLATDESGTIADLNNRNRQETLHIHLEDGAAPDRPLELVFVTDDRSSDRLVAPRVLITAGGGSRAVVIERHLDLGRDPVLNVPVVEVLCGPGSDITHLKWLGNGPDALHYGGTFVRQDEGSRYVSREFVLAGHRVRREMHLHLAGPGASCILAGLTLASGLRHTDVRTRVYHDVPGCTTDELYKGILIDRGQSVFDGLIRVAPDAQQTGAYQTNRNLLLSDDAVSYSIPRLEIYADDVKCSHGSTTGQLSAEEMFYLRSRGFDEMMARRLLSYAFASEVVDQVEHPGLREELTASIQQILDKVPS